jgi:hypothetical protein
MVRYFAVAGLLLTLVVPAHSQDHRGYPYSIMNPEPGTRAARAKQPLAKTLREPRGRVKLTHRSTLRAHAGRGSGSVPNLTLPKTQAIPPVATSPPPVPRRQARGPTIVPGVGAVPNLPPAVGNRAETFQDRAARCHHQMGVFGVPNSATTAYMGACAN